MHKMPKQKPGQSKQDVATPENFLKAVKRRYGYLRGQDDLEFSYDLAADPSNTTAATYFTEEDNALVQDWHTIPGLLWCNPPYGKIEPWVKKACEEAALGADILMLVPASVGADWWRRYVDAHAWVQLLNGRLKFVGHKNYYPKDLALLTYNRTSLEHPHYSIWNWRETL